MAASRCNRKLDFRNRKSMTLPRFLYLILLGIAGCGGPQPTEADPVRAKAALQTALDAWKNGDNEDSLKQRQPAVFVNEPAWRAGHQLVKYQIDSEQKNGLSWRYEVLLTLKAGQEKPKQQQALYTVDTDPAVVVVRD
jgi:hypothetical protein